MRKMLIAMMVLTAVFATRGAAALRAGGDMPIFDDARLAAYTTYLYDYGPEIVNITHSPLRPLEGQRIKVTAKIFRNINRSSQPVAGATLRFSNDGVNFDEFPMLRDDKYPDLYYGYIPPQKAGVKLVYALSAVDVVGNVTAELPGMVTNWDNESEPLNNMIGVIDQADDDTVVPAPIDIIGLKLGYDATSLYAQIDFRGKPGSGNMATTGAYTYMMPIFNYDTGKGTENLLDTPGLLYAPVMAGVLGTPKFGLFKPKELMGSRKPIPGADMKMRKNQGNSLVFRFNRAALGPNPSNRLQTAMITIAMKSPDALLPWEASPYLTVIMKSHSVDIGSIADAPEYAVKAGASRKDISPPIGTPLSGYGDRQGRPSTGVHDPLMAQALVLQFGDEKIALVTADFFYFRRDIYREMGRMVEEKTGIPADHIIISASHSHSSSGGMFPEIALLGGKTTRKLYEAVRQKLVDVVVDANSKLQPAKIGWGSADGTGLSNNRREKGGPVDPQINILRVDSIAGKPIAVYYNFAAHPTTMGGGNMTFSSDFVGPSRKTVEAAFPGATAMFVNGTQGDISPNCPGNCEGGFKSAERTGQVLAQRIIESAKKISLEPKTGFTFRNQEAVIDPRYDMRISMASFRIGKAGFVTVPGEMYVDFGLAIKKQAAAMGFDTVDILGLSDDGVGYIIDEEFYYKHVYEATFAIFGPKEGPFLRDEAIRMLGEVRPK